MPKVVWSSETLVDSVEALDDVLDRISVGCSDAKPVIAFIQDLHGGRVDVGLGGEESVILIWPSWPTDTNRSYYFTIGSPTRSGVTDFYLLGEHHTQLNNSMLIPINLARTIIREFYETGQRSTLVEWQEDYY